MFVDILINDCCNLINILCTFIDCPLIFVFLIANSGIAQIHLIGAVQNYNLLCRFQQILIGSEGSISLDSQKLLNNDQNRCKVGPMIYEVLSIGNVIYLYIHYYNYIKRSTFFVASKWNFLVTIDTVIFPLKCPYRFYGNKKI